MPSKTSSRYISLLKRSLTDYHNVGTSELHPLSTVEPNWKTALLHSLDQLLRMRNFTICKMEPVTAEGRTGGSDWPANALTMVGMERLDHLEECITKIAEQNIPGDLIETGVWRGGAAIFMRAMLNELALEDRNVWLADSFEGIPVPDPDAWPADKGNALHKVRMLSVPLSVVQGNFARFDLLDDRVKFLKGWFKDTLPIAPIQELALLRLTAICTAQRWSLWNACTRKSPSEGS